MSDHIRLNQADGVLEILFSRPEKKNALTNSMYREARGAFERAQQDKSIQVVLFGAEGDIFTSGNDLEDFASIAQGKGGELEAQAFVEALGQAVKPVVAAVPGLAVGVGTTMLLHCDLVYVADTARLSAPFVDLALVPEAGSSFLLPARIGHVRAFAMFALGESISGPEAVTLGIANKALPQKEVLAAARSATRALAKRPSRSVLATKQLMRDVQAVMAQMHKEAALFSAQLKSDEAREAFSAFAEKRQPDFSRFSN